MKVWAGIDPGNEGCLALLFESGQIEFHDAPTAIVKSGKRSRTVLVPQEMANVIGGPAAAKSYRIPVYVEKVSAIPKQGIASPVNVGVGYRMWPGVLAGLVNPHTPRNPHPWAARSPQRRAGTRRPALSQIPTAASHPAKRLGRGNPASRSLRRPSTSAWRLSPARRSNSGIRSGSS